MVDLSRRSFLSRLLTGDETLDQGNMSVINSPKKDLPQKALSDSTRGGTTRRGFLAGLCALFAYQTIAAPAKKVGLGLGSAPTKTPPKSPAVSPKAFEDILVQAYLPTLKLNEAELLHFKRISEKELSVGYGSNILALPGLLDHINVFHNGKAMAEKDRRAFARNIASKTDAELKTYTVVAADAEKIALEYSRHSVQELKKIFDTVKGGKAFFDMPLCMQVLALDVYYNLPPAKFKKYVNFQAALNAGDYAKAVEESRVWANIEKRIVNEERERRKQRLYDVMCIVQNHPTETLAQLNERVDAVYREKTPALTRKLIGKKDLTALHMLIEGSVRWAALKRQAKGLSKVQPSPKRIQGVVR